MTNPAGSIGIGVSIDASDIASELTTAVEKSLKPALAKIEKMIDGLTRDLDKLDGSGFKDVAKAAGDAEDKIGRAAKEQQRFAQSTKSTDTSGIKKSASAYDDVAKAARKAADATKDVGKGGGGGEFLDNIKSKLGGLSSSAKSAGSNLGEGIIAGAAPRLAVLGTAGGPIGLALTAAAALGVGAGALLAKNILSGLDRLQSQANLAAKIGLTPEQVKPIAKASAEAYASNFGESVEANMDAARAAIQSGLIDPNASQADVQKVVEQLNTVSTVMGEDIPQVARAASQAIKTGLAKDATGAVDLFVKAQQSGLNVSEDFIDTITEYGTQFRQLGLDGPEALGLISQAVKGGARDTDTAADALKEFAIRAIDGSKTSTEAYAAAGLNAEEYTKRIAEGGPTAKKAFGEVLTAISSITDPVKQNAVAVGLFGTKAEDLGRAFGNMNLDTAVAQFGQVEGAAQRAADTMGNTAVGSFNQLKRTVEVAMGTVQTKLAEAFGPSLQQAADWVTAHKEDIVGFFIDLGKVAVMAADFVLEGVGQIVQGLGNLIAPLGDTYGALLKVESGLQRLTGNTERADELNREAEAAFGWGEGLQAVGQALRDWDPSSVINSLDGVKTELINAKDNAALLADSITTLPDGQVVLKEDTPEAIQRVKDLGYAVERLPDGSLTIKVVYRDQNGKPIPPDQLVTPARSVDLPAGVTGGRAEGGVLPGYSPGRDNMLVPMSGGEGVIIPEAMRALGGRWLYNLNSSFRSGISRRGYARGGVVGYEGGGVVPALSPEQQAIADALVAALAPAVGLLGEIRDLIKAQLPDTKTTADATSALATDATKGGTAPLGLNTPTEDQAKALAPLTAGLIDLVQSGDYKGGLGALGILEDSPIVDALLTARETAGAIPDLIQALTALTEKGDYTGTFGKYGLPEDSPIIDELFKVREAVVQNGIDGSKTTGLAAFVGTDANVTATPTGRIQQAVSLAKNAAAKGSYSYGGVGGPDNTLYDCSGLMSDLFAVLTGKPYSGTERYFTTESNFPGLGFVEGYNPNSPFNVGINRGGGGPNSHIVGQINGVNVEAGGSTGGIAYGPNATDPRSMQMQYHLPPELVGAMTGAMSDASAGSAADMCACFGDQLTGGAGQNPPIADAMGNALKSALSAVLPMLMNDLIDALLQVPPNQSPEEQATLRQLLSERSPAALAKVAGYDVGRYAQFGGGPDAQRDNLTKNEGPGNDAKGQLYSDTSALLDRTLTSLEKANQARHEQLMGIMTQVRDQLTEKLLKPTLEAGVSAGIDGIGTATSSAIGSAMGQAAAPPIAQAVGAAVAANTPAPAPAAAPAVALPGLASGGPITGPGTSTSDSILARLSHGEYVLSAATVSRMGGFAGVERMVGSLPGYATGGGVNVNEVVGAEFFGVSQVPLLGLLVNILIRVLLAVLGVQIEARDTLSEMTDTFRDFRGDFKAFDATGRLLNDTSALLDRSQSSEELATQERIRILKIVIQALIEYIIEKVIVPLAKAAANAMLQFGAAAASTGINAGLGAAGAPGAGAPIAGLVSSLITGVGGAGVDIIAEVGAEIAVSLSEVLIDSIGDILLGVFPGLTGAIFGQALGPISDMFVSVIADPILGLFGGLFSGINLLMAPLLAGVGGIIGLAGIGGAAGGGLFDSGGVARGTGLMPKATLAPERVLSPQQTAAFDRLVSVLTTNRPTTASNQTVIHAPFTVTGGEDGGRRAHSRLLELMS